jgi:hypothetical protein
VLQPRTLLTLAALLAVYGLLVLAAYLGPPSLEPLGWYVVVIPILAVHLLHHYGVPGLLEHNGACGWGWCSPTPAGWTVLVVLWLGAAWLVAWAISHFLFRRRSR